MVFTPEQSNKIASVLGKLEDKILKECDITAANSDGVTIANIYTTVKDVVDEFETNPNLSDDSTKEIIKEFKDAIIGGSILLMFVMRGISISYPMFLKSYNDTRGTSYPRYSIDALNSFMLVSSKFMELTMIDERFTDEHVQNTTLMANKLFKKNILLPKKVKKWLDKMTKKEDKNSSNSNSAKLFPTVVMAKIMMMRYITSNDALPFKDILIIQSNASARRMRVDPTL